MSTGRPRCGSLRGTLAATQASARRRVSVRRQLPCVRRRSRRAGRRGRRGRRGPGPRTSRRGRRAPGRAGGRSGRNGPAAASATASRRPTNERSTRSVLAAPQQRRDDADGGDEQKRPDRLPQPIEVRERGHRVVLEPQPACASEALHARDVVPGGAGVDEHERACQREARRPRAPRHDRARATAPSPATATGTAAITPGTSPTRPGRPRARPTRSAPRPRARART